MSGSPAAWPAPEDECELSDRPVKLGYGLGPRLPWGGRELQVKYRVHLLMDMFQGSLT